MERDEKIEIIHDGEIILIEPSKMVNVPSATIHIENDLTLLQKKLWFELVYKAFPVMGKQAEYTIKLSELKKQIGWEETTGSDNKLKEALYGLTQKAIQWNIFRKDKKNFWEAFPLLAGCRIPDNSGLCIFAFSPFLQERFLSMGEEAYVKIDLIVSNRFESKYALSIYCLALDYLILKIGSSEKNFSLEQLRRYLAIKEGEYKKINDFSRRVIEPAQKEINELSDMDIKIEPFKDGKKISGYKFSMSLKEGRKEIYLQRKNKLKEAVDNSVLLLEDKKKEFFVKSDVVFTNPELKSFFSKHNISAHTDTFKEKFQTLQEEFGNSMENIEKYLVYLSHYAEKEIQNGSIKNMAGFYVSLFKNDVQLDNYFDLVQKEIEVEKRINSQIENKVQNKIKEKFQLSESVQFYEYIVKNVDKLEADIIEILTPIKKGFAYDVVIKGKNNGVVDKTLITNYPRKFQTFITNELVPFKNKLGFIPLTFEEWKEQTLNDSYLEEIRAEVKKDLRF